MPETTPSLVDTIVVRGAREHNLKDIDIDIPKDSLVVVTGLSGSGKSSLAFDTIYAEGQRRYVESLSAYARQFLEQMEKPNVDALEGLAPAISIEQKTTNQSPRSTVGTITEIYDYLRLLYAKMAKPVSPDSGEELTTFSPEQIVDRIMSLEKDTRVQLLAPIVVARKGEHAKELEAARRAGFSKVRVNKETHDLLDEIPIEKNKKNNISIVIDRLIIRPDARKRLSQSVDSALKLAGAIYIEAQLPSGEFTAFTLSTGLSYGEAGTVLPKLEPRLFSFNSPLGACPACNGLGYLNEFDPYKIAPNPELSIEEGALENWTGRFPPNSPTHEAQVIACVANHFRFSLKTPLESLSEKNFSILFYGSGKEEIEFSFRGRQSKYKTKRKFSGVIHDFQKKLDVATPDELAYLEKYISKKSCTACNGDRLRPESLAFRILGKNIAEVSALELTPALEFFKSIKLSERDQAVAGAVLKEIVSRLEFLLGVGLSYLSLSRQANSLSGGEMQRVRLATQIGASLVGVLYVLDEPSIGLHQRDNERLLSSLKELRDRGNTVIVVEHDRDTIEAADHVIDMGPAAGKQGGKIIAEGTPKEIIAAKNSITGHYLSGIDKIPVPDVRRPRSKERQVVLKGCSLNNLKSITASFPLGLLLCISGVSGSGKSTLIFDTLIPAIQANRRKNKQNVGYTEALGLDLVDRIIHVDQSPIGRTPRSNPATYSGLFSPIRTLFSQTVDAQIMGFEPGRFSFNVKGGRCETCEGAGAIRVEMHFLPDVFVPCHICNGKRYNRETLSVRYKGKNIAEVLAMTVEEALEFFANIPSIERILRVLSDVGLGYITLGQSATTLSGGEAQRMKLSRELSKRSTGRSIYVLDEPSTGLHFKDIHQLIKVLHALVDQGNTVIVIEHNLDILKHADYLIDLGQEGGSGGGEIIAEGTPEEVVKKGIGYTAKYLKPYLK